jgi:hypothetical protein
MCRYTLLSCVLLSDFSRDVYFMDDVLVMCVAVASVRAQAPVTRNALTL